MATSPGRHSGRTADPRLIAGVFELALAERAIELGADHVLHDGAGVIDAPRRLTALLGLVEDIAHDGPSWCEALSRILNGLAAKNS